MIDGESNGEALQPQLPLGTPVLLHEGNDDGTLVVHVIVIHFSESDTVLRVVPERLWWNIKIKLKLNVSGGTLKIC